MGPEESMRIQSNLASTIAMAFDECIENPSEYDYTRKSVDRTARWLERCKKELDRLNEMPNTINKKQMLFGINQGGTYDDIRTEHMQKIAELNLDGYAIGVLSESIDVGIISPYRAQVQYLKKLIKKYEFFKPYRRLISVNTVDGFQGQERDVILISLVRSNDEGQIGFLKDLRRMNVAMTRARMKLIILGNKDTMTKHPFYKKLWEYVEAINNNE